MYGCDDRDAGVHARCLDISLEDLDVGWVGSRRSLFWAEQARHTDTCSSVEDIGSLADAYHAACTALCVETQAAIAAPRAASQTVQKDLENYPYKNPSRQIGYALLINSRSEIPRRAAPGAPPRGETGTQKGSKVGKDRALQVGTCRNKELEGSFCMQGIPGRCPRECALCPETDPAHASGTSTCLYGEWWLQIASL